jgi:hypothetical protein
LPGTTIALRPHGNLLPGRPIATFAAAVTVLTVEA